MSADRFNDESCAGLLADVDCALEAPLAPLTPPTLTVTIGPPGTGKTTQAAKDFAAEMSAHRTPPEAVYFITFSRRAAQEGKYKLRDPSGPHRFEDHQVENVRTMHSLAYKLLAGQHGKKWEDEHWGEFAQTNGWRFDRGGADKPLLDLFKKARALGYELAEVDKIRSSQVFDRVRLNRLVRDYCEFKAKHDLLDYQDALDIMLRERLVPPGIEAIFFDEAQDFSPTQARVADLWASAARRVYVYGDDDQTIYGFAGASPDWLQRKYEEATSKTVLSQSHRCPALVLQCAERIIGRNGKRIAKQCAPRPEPGLIVEVASIDDVIRNLDGGTNLVLAHERFFLTEVRKHLKAKGVPFLDVDDRRAEHSLEEAQAVKAAECAQMLSFGVEVAAKDVKNLVDHVGYRRRDLVPHRPALFDALEKLGDAQLGPARLNALLGGGRLLEELQKSGPLGVLSLEEREERAVTALLQGAAAQPRIVLSTIHQAKGAEADVVAIIPDMSQKSFNEWTANAEATNRLAYVAVTRTRQKLVLMRGTGRYAYPDYFAPRRPR